MKDETSQRLERLEANATHLEHQVEQLNGVIIEQGKLLERLKKEVQKQATLLESQIATLEPPGADENVLLVDIGRPPGAVAADIIERLHLTA